tara:strand:+ start:3086 stop:4081 length:996 start_codon:yes stop_codon:yes gene_type:complete
MANIGGVHMPGVASDITELIGNTPLVQIKGINDDKSAIVLGKFEIKNPGGSVKDRTALSMINTAEADGVINPQKSVIIEPTSGNTGISLAMIAAARGYRCIITMPETMSIERRQLLMLLGAKVVLTPGPNGMNGAISKAEEIRDMTPGGWIPQQFENPANPSIHEGTTAEEIWRDTAGKIDILISPVGTGGTATGCARALKPKKPTLQVIGVEPSRSPVLSGGPPGPHRIQGIGAGFVPDTLDTHLLDTIVQIDDEEAEKTARELALKDGIFVGVSAGASVAAALKVARQPESKDKVIVCILCDTGERYLSHPAFESVVHAAEVATPWSDS